MHHLAKKESMSLYVVMQGQMIVQLTCTATAARVQACALHCSVEHGREGSHHGGGETAAAEQQQQLKSTVFGRQMSVG
jgi:hypothetical protein